MVQVSRTTKFTFFCIGVYISYVIFVFFLLPLLMPDPVTLQRAVVAYKTRHLGNLSNYTLETGGQPVRSMLVTFRGSGALTLLDNLAHQPGCYQHYAPLIAYQNRCKAQQQPARVLDELVALYNCNYNKSAEMIHWGMQSRIFRRFYGVQSKICLTHSWTDCWDADNLAGVCKLHPFINMAVYNLRLEYLASLLDREGLNLRILLLVRDPRGTMYTRMQRQWCVGEEDCDAGTLCQDMVSDYKMAETLAKNYPKRFGTVRYEDLLKQPEESIKLVFDFYGIPLARRKRRTGGAHPSNGDVVESLGWDLPWQYSNQPAYEWITKMNVTDIKALQSVCADAMDLWGYRQIQDFEHFSPSEFEPLMGKDLEK